jgi:tRNA threonylcarbamoyladenosine biosynthesis protein TsaB
VLTARYALRAWEDQDPDKVVEYGELLPDYMRESEAEQRLKDGSLEKMRKAKLEKLMKMAGK